MSDPHSTGGPPTHVQDGARQPSHAERVRTLLAGRTDGVLSTVALDPAGFPFGSIVTFAVDPAGAPLVLMSDMAEHARNLAADPCASLLVAADGDGSGRLAVARATLLGEVQRIPDDQQDAATAAYLAVHPGAFWARFPDFAMHRLDVQAVRYVRGFGEMSWVDIDAYPDAEADPVAAAESRIVEHMNEDHQGAMALMVDAFLEVPHPVGEVTMLSCDRYGFELRLSMAGGPHEVAFARLAFDQPLADGSEARSAMVALTTRAREH